MNKINLIFIIFYIVLLNSCNSGDLSINNPLVGSWKIVKAEGVAASVNKGIEYNFKADGSLTTGAGIMKNKYKYTINDDTLKMDYNGESNFVQKWIFIINDNKMTMKNTTINQTLFLEK